MDDDLAAALRRDVATLATEIGPRHVPGREAALTRARGWLEGGLVAAGWDVHLETFDAAGHAVANVVAERPGTVGAGGVVVVGAHYDAVPGTPGADDNASGVAALLAIARGLDQTPRPRAVRLVGFVNEEPPWFQGPHMGSVVHARGCTARGEDVVAMLSLETIGYYDPRPGSQGFPLPALAARFPTTGDFLAMVGAPGSEALLARAEASFRRHGAFPLQAAILPPELPGVGWSDQWAFWQEGYPGLMLTDTAPFRNPHYHLRTDTPEILDFAALAAIARTLVAVVRDLAGPP